MFSARQIAAPHLLGGDRDARDLFLLSARSIPPTRKKCPFFVIDPNRRADTESYPCEEKFFDERHKRHFLPWVSGSWREVPASA